jgi:uncharacterized protein YcbK (DUF882 family)
MLNFSISELIKSDIADKNGIKNMPDVASLDNLLQLIFYVLQPLRDKVKRPIVITSGYRCKKVNQLTGGKTTSQHLNGKAADFIIVGMSVQQAIDFVKRSGIEFDQLIHEKIGNKEWVHISYNKGNNRKQFIQIKQ